MRIAVVYRLGELVTDGIGGPCMIGRIGGNSVKYEEEVLDIEAGHSWSVEKCNEWSSGNLDIHHFLFIFEKF